MCQVDDAAHHTEQQADEVEIARQTLASLNPKNSAYFAAFNKYTNILMSRFARSQNPSDLDEAIACTRQVLDLVSPGHSFRAAALCIMGMALIKNFKFRGDTDDLTQAVNYLEAAVESCTPEQSLYIPFVNNLASGLLNRYWMYGDMADLDQIIQVASAALSGSPAECSNRDSLLNNLATAFKERFAKQGNRADLDTTLVHYQSCLGLRPLGHPSRHTALGNFADGLLLRFDIDGQLQDLENAVGCYVSALQLRSPGEEGHLLCLTNLGTVYWRLFNVTGNVESLETAIGYYQSAMEHSQMPNLDHSRLLDNYGAALQSRYVLLGNIEDLNQAIQYLTTSSHILPPTYAGRPVTLFNLAAALLTRSDATSDIADLDSSIEIFTSVLQSCAPGYHQRPAILSAYGRALLSRFRAMGSVENLDQATTMCKDALTLSSPGTAEYSSIVANLSSILLECFQTSGDIEQCQTVIDHCDHALVSTQLGEPAFVSLSVNRAKAFLQKFRHGREEKDIDTCLTAFREIIPTIPEGHADHASAHLQFGMAFQARFALTADQKDLDGAIELYRIAHRNCRRNNFLYVSICIQLGNGLRERFESLDDADALDEAIVLLAEAEEILALSPGRDDYKASLVNLGAALFMRFQTQRNKSDLDTAVERLSHALTLPAFSEEFLIALDLATILFVRYKRNKNMADLDRCAELFGVLADQVPPKHLLRAKLCRGYGIVLVHLESPHDRLQHLNAAILLFKEAIEHLPPSHKDHLWTCMYLASALHTRAELLYDDDDLNAAINIFRKLIQSLPEDHPMFHTLCSRAAGLAMSLYALSPQHASSLVEEGFQCYEKAARYAYAHSFTSVSIAFEWAEKAEKFHHSSALLAYQTSLDFLNQHLLVTASLTSRRVALLDEDWVRPAGTLATDATACAVVQGELTLAAELSEQGRGMLWSQLSQSRTPLDALRSASDTGRGLASDFERVSAQLERSSVVTGELHGAMLESRLATEGAAHRYKQLSRELRDIIARIQSQEGFQSFLNRPSFESLQRAAVGGPVILINVSHKRCDALVVLQGGPPRLIPLPDTSLEELARVSERFHHMLRTTTSVGEEKIREREAVVVLRTLWDTIVRPVVDELTSLAPRGARIWWCPTSKLTMLPLHAAGPYRKGALNLSNIYVSSYTPTLTALIRARYRPSPSTIPPAFIAIGQAQPASSTGPALQTVSTELALVHSLLPCSSNETHTSAQPLGCTTFSMLDGEGSTADAALAALATHGWAHLACHGHPNADRPFSAAFALNDREMTVLDIVRARGITVEPDTPNNASTISAGTTPGGFAFLSACHTTVGDRQAPDEVIHLAAAMQFTGFRSVIGTMWAVDDAMVQHMVRAFYECMFADRREDGGGGDVNDGHDGRWDCTRAARALNKATKTVDKNMVSLDQRIVFVHIGA